MIEVLKILYGYYDNIIKISLLPDVDVATGGKKINCIKVMLNMILDSTFSQTECCHYGIVCLMVLWTLILLIVLKVD